MRHFAHHIGDYAAATRHLSFVEDAAYRRLLDRYYQDEKPLPADLAAVVRLAGARTKDERQAVANVLSEFFLLGDDGYRQARADREIETYRAKAQAARENGTKGGRPVNREKTKTVSSQVQSEKLTTNHSPLTIDSVPNGTGAKAPARDVIFAECLPWLEKRSGKNCRALVGKWLSETGDDDAIRGLLEQAEQENPVDPVSWIAARLKPKEAHETYDQRRIRLGREAIREAMPQ